MKIEEKNAVITDVDVVIDRGIFLCVWIGLKYRVCNQNFGGFVLGRSDRDNLEQPNYAGEFLTQIMKIAGVEDLKKMKGKTIRVRASQMGVEEIGQIVEDIWWSPKEAFEKAEKRGVTT